MSLSIAVETEGPGGGLQGRFNALLRQGEIDEFGAGKELRGEPAKTHIKAATLHLTRGAKEVIFKTPEHLARASAEQGIHQTAAVHFKLPAVAAHGSLRGN